jgi:hypothetical protein
MREYIEGVISRMDKETAELILFHEEHRETTLVSVHKLREYFPEARTSVYFRLTAIKTGTGYIPLIEKINPPETSSRNYVPPNERLSSAQLAELSINARDIDEAL